MAVDITPKKRALFLVTILIAASVQMSDFIVMPVMNDWYVTYADQLGLVNYAMTGSLVGMFFGALISGKAAQYVNKKIIYIVGTLMFLIGGVGIMFTDSIVVICVLRTISGFAFGGCSTATYALINEIYEDESQRSKIISAL